jgi:hypothetical protein
MRLEKITGEVVDKWLDYMIAQDYEHSAVNGYYGMLMTMMKCAARKRYIMRDPFLDVEKLIDPLDFEEVPKIQAELLKNRP